MAYNYQQGEIEITNWDKYLGKKNPRYLSSYEQRMYMWADRSPNVIQWSVETVVVPYWSSVKKRKARYIVDLYLKYRDRHGEVREALIEIKPLAQAKKPVRGRKRRDVYDAEMLTYITNMEKWEAAEKFAKKRGWEFKVMTENSIFRY